MFLIHVSQIFPAARGGDFPDGHLHNAWLQVLRWRLLAGTLSTNAASYLILFKYVVLWKQSELWIHPCYPTSPNIHIRVFINKLKFLFALTLWSPVIYHRNITGAVLTYCTQRHCRSGIYCCHMVDFSGQCPSCGTAGKPLHRSSSLTVSLLGRSSSFGNWFLCAVYNFIFKPWINEFSILDVNALQDQRQTCYSGHLLSWKDFYLSRDIASAYWRCWSWDLH